ncbi:MAG: sigma-54-dependent Fis family transcriptional regulator [Candidatus Eisenbacteria bacterium]|nr:sigma-54-dependent Fis family transcriptional regulator [Candidatus Eisenbacteria bacterium]
MNVVTRTEADTRARALIVDGEALLRDYLREVLTRRGFAVDTAADGVEAMTRLRANGYRLLFADSRAETADGVNLVRAAREIAPDLRSVVMAAYATVENAVESMRLGACDYLTKPFQTDEVERIVERVLGPDCLHAQTPGPSSPEWEMERDMVGESRQIREIFALIRLAAGTEATVLITGETGTGKELVAREIHRRSRRSRGRFVRLNCAALPEALYESELFGHERGAFTGAVRQKKGRFELAHNGTLLMDEISEIGWGVQAKLLRVLQEKEFERVGGCQTIRADSRVIATTNKDLAREIREDRFRADLYYRLSVFPINVPPLRERAEDIPILIDHFLARHCRQNGLGYKEIGRAAMELLAEYPWPGNVRQLENSLERAALVSPGRIVEPEHFPELVNEMEVERRAMTDEHVPSVTTLRDMEATLLLKTLEEEDGNRTRAARRLGITARTLRNKLHRLGMMDYMKPGRSGGKQFPPRPEKSTRTAPEEPGVLVQSQY